MKRFLFVSLALAVSMMAAERGAFAQLTPLPDGTSISSVGTATETGTLLATSTGTFSTPAGTFTESVYLETGGTLNFDFSVTNTSAPAAGSAYAHVTTANFDSFLTSVGYTLGTGVAPSAADRLVAGVVNFTFSGTGIASGSSSDTLIVSTNAKNYMSGTISVQDGTASTGVPNVFAPTTGVLAPEPSTMALAGLGALGFVGYGLRRRKALGA